MYNWLLEIRCANCNYQLEYAVGNCNMPLNTTTTIRNHDCCDSKDVIVKFEVKHERQYTTYNHERGQKV